ncbi:MAG: hypothetical protein JXL97_17305 [Bacteroidales bacterium]|nr:hypothetical protein [Bacteroidales bacterium]
MELLENKKPWFKNQGFFAARCNHTKTAGRLISFDWGHPNPLSLYRNTITKISIKKGNVNAVKHSFL